jgi:hypothetical protein
LSNKYIENRKKSHGGCINIDTIERGAAVLAPRRKIISPPPSPLAFLFKRKRVLDVNV